MKALRPPSLGEIEAARSRLEGLSLRTPLIRFEHGGDREIYLKLENLQTVGSFKVRGAGNAIRSLRRERLLEGVSTASAGNMAQGVAWVARQLEVGCRVLIPSTAPAAKKSAIERLGAELIEIDFDEWWRAMVDHGSARLGGGPFVHPVSDPAVIAGNATIGLELAEDLDDFDTVVVPFGGGGLSCGIAAALGHLRPAVSVYAAEVDTAAPLAASIAAGRPSSIRRRASFVDGIGGSGVLEEMWPMASTILAGSIQVAVEKVAAAIGMLIERCNVVAEGAGAASLAAVLGGRVPGRRVVCIVSGGNIDRSHLGAILAGATPVVA